MRWGIPIFVGGCWATSSGWTPYCVPQPVLPPGRPVPLQHQPPARCSQHHLRPGLLLQGRWRLFPLSQTCNIVWCHNKSQVIHLTIRTLATNLLLGTGSRFCQILSRRPGLRRLRSVWALVSMCPLYWPTFGGRVRSGREVNMSWVYPFTYVGITLALQYTPRTNIVFLHHHGNSPSHSKLNKLIWMKTPISNIPFPHFSQSLTNH